MSVGSGAKEIKKIQSLLLGTVMVSVAALVILSIVSFSKYQSQYLRQQHQQQRTRRTAITSRNDNGEISFYSNVHEITTFELMANLGDLQTYLQNSWRQLDEKCVNNTKHDETCIQKFANVYMGADSIKENEKQITLATHCGADKTSNLLTQKDWWAGPISVAIYISKAEDVDMLMTFIKERGDSLNLSQIHVMMESFHGQEYEGYPHNRLRNLALGAVVTDYVLLMDVDFITNPGAHDKFLDLIYDNKNNSATSMHDKLHSKHVFALPAFDVLPLAGEEAANASLLPRTKEEVLQGMENGTIVPFYKKTCKEAHAFYKYSTWMKKGGTEERKNEPYYEVPFLRYSEPYVLSLTKGLPQYHEAFRGYGFDKQSYFFNLDRVGYKFNVLEDFYAAHLHHPTVSGKEKKQGLLRNFDLWLSYCNCTVSWSPKQA